MADFPSPTDGFVSQAPGSPASGAPGPAPWPLLLLLALGIGVGASLMSLPGVGTPRLGEVGLATSVRGTAVPPSFPSRLPATPTASENGGAGRSPSTKCRCPYARTAPVRPPAERSECLQEVRLSPSDWQHVVAPLAL